MIGVPRFVHVNTSFDSGITPTTGRQRNSFISAIDKDSSASALNGSYLVINNVWVTSWTSPNSARLELELMKPTILSASLQEDNSGFVTIMASSAKYMACRAPDSIPAGLSKTTYSKLSAKPDKTRSTPSTVKHSLSLV
eukprot:361313_1